MRSIIKINKFYDRHNVGIYGYINTQIIFTVWFLLTLSNKQSFYSFFVSTSLIFVRFVWYAISHNILLFMAQGWRIFSRKECKTHNNFLIWFHFLVFCVQIIRFRCRYRLVSYKLKCQTNMNGCPTEFNLVPSIFWFHGNCKIWIKYKIENKSRESGKR